MATQKTVMERAKQGDGDAIAHLMNRSLKKGILNGQPAKVQIRQQGGEYRLLLISQQPLDKSKAVRWIMQGLQKLAIPNLTTVTIYGKSQQSDQPDWQYRMQRSAKDSASVHALKSSMPESPESTTASEPKPSPTTLSEASIDLSEYCFTRNKSLLTGELNPPAKVVSQLVLSFAALPNAQKPLLVPHLTKVLRKPAPVEDDSLTADSQAWIEQVMTLEGNDLRRFSIWLSRYCQQPAATVAQLSPNASAIEASSPDSSVQSTSQQSSSPSEVTVTEDESGNRVYDLGYQPSQSAAHSHGASTRHHSSQGTSSTQVISHAPIKTPAKLKWGIPLAWSICLAFIVMLGIGSAKSAGVATAATPNSYAICEVASSSQEACALAVQLTGDETWFQDIVADTVPLKPEFKSTALEWCSEYVNYEAGLLSETVSTAPAVVASQSEEIFPGVLLTSVTQQSQTNPGETLRVACVNYGYTYTADDGMPAEYVGTVELEELAVDFIPVSWPNEPYAGGLEMAATAALTDTFGFYEPLIRLFAYPLFTAAGLALAVLFSPCYSSRSTMGIYKTAAVLGAINLFTFSLPLGWRLMVLLEVLALGLASRLVKEFEVTWSGGRTGYGLLAFGAGTVIVVRGILTFLLTVLLYGSASAALFSMAV